MDNLFGLETSILRGESMAAGNRGTALPETGRERLSHHRIPMKNREVAYVLTPELQHRRYGGLLSMGTIALYTNRTLFRLRQGCLVRNLKTPYRIGNDSTFSPSLACESFPP